MIRQAFDNAWQFSRLDRPLDPETDHILGPPDAPVSLVEYGSYACSYCRVLHERIVQLRDQRLWRRGVPPLKARRIAEATRCATRSRLPLYGRSMQFMVIGVAENA